MQARVTAPLLALRKYASRRMGLTSFLVLGAVSLCFYLHRVVLARRGPSDPFVMSDHIAYFLPTTAFLRRSILNGEIPLWNPYQFAGQPIAALHMSGMLYPLNWVVAAAFDAWNAQQVHVIVHLTLCGWFTWLFVRRLGVSPLAGGVAAIVYTLCDYTIYSITFPPYLSTQTWLPAILWAMLGLLQTLRLRWVIAVAVFIALALVGGHAQAFLYIAQFGVACALFWLWSVSEPGGRRRAFLLLALAGLIGVGLAGPQLLPAIEMTMHASRSVEALSLNQASSYSLPLSRLGNGILESLRFTTGQDGRPNSVLHVWPLLTLPLALFGVFSTRLRLQWCFLFVSLVVAGLFMAGKSTPIFRMHYELPMGSLFRAPLRAGFLYMWLVAVLAAIGTQTLIDWLVSKEKVRAARGLGIAVLLIVAGDVYQRAGFHPNHPLLSPRPTPPSAELLQALRGGDQLDRSFFELSPAHERSLGYKAGTLYGFQSLPDYEPAMLADYARFFSVDRPELWHGFMAVATWPHERDQLARLLDLASVSRFVLPLNSPTPTHALRQQFAGLPKRAIGDLVLVSRKSPLPRAYSVSCVRTASSSDVVLATISEDSFSPTEEVIIEADTNSGFDFSGLSCSDDSRGTVRRATVLEYSSREVVISASCERACILVLTDLEYPGWNATVDGAASGILRANGLFRAVLMEAGDHRVVFRFDPWTWRIGLALFAICLTTIAAIAQRDSSSAR